jgi:hypothetical protein
MSNEPEILRDYFQSLAENYSPIGHTATLKRFFENALAEIKNPAPGVIMYFAPPIATMSEQDGTQVIRMNIGISILRNFTKGDFADLHRAIRETYSHCKEILARINEDKLSESTPAATRCLLERFSIDDTTIEADDARMDGWIGCTLSFPLILNEFFETTRELWP